MHFKAAVANSLWMAANIPGHRRFLHALQNPAAAQEAKLADLLKANSETAWGAAHQFRKISNYDDFVRHVALSDYAAMEPWIHRIREGDTNVLARGAVTHLIPTSGTSGARKLIPFTRRFQAEMNAAIAPWMFDLVRQRPGLLGGRAYWSISPCLQSAPPEPSKIPIGFDDDSAYLAGWKRALANATMAVPNTLARAESLEAFQFQTWLHLLQCRDLRLISIWHPSFLILLLDALPAFWKKLRQALPRLANASPNSPASFWPNLKLISCWADSVASLSIRELQRRFPKVAIQPKGLLASECFVSIPFQGEFPLCVTSHFFEFIDAQGNVFRLHEIRTGHEYEVIVTTSGGLWRYRLGDRILVTGFLRNTPTIQFLGRGNAVSDRFGEKLSEQFAAEVLQQYFGDDPPQFALLAPEEDEQGCRYVLFFEGTKGLFDPDKLDRLLRRNPNFDYCRRLGQLLAPQIVRVANGFHSYAARQSQNGARLGDVKPRSLSGESGWLDFFSVPKPPNIS